MERGNIGEWEGAIGSVRGELGSGIKGSICMESEGRK